MASYDGRHAGLYDLFYADKPYESEAKFLVDQISRMTALRDVLDVACGTGRHAEALANQGLDVTGVDHSASMIEQARRRFENSAVSAEFEVQDMVALDLGRQFDAVLCLFDSIGYTQTNEHLQSFLIRVRDHLRPDGVFAFEFWHAAAMLRSFEPARVRRFASEAGDVVRISETSLRPAEQLSDVRYTVFEPVGDNRYVQFCETQTNRYFLIPEMERHLASAELSAQHWFAGYREAGEVSTDTWHVVCLARRAR